MWNSINAGITAVTLLLFSVICGVIAAACAGAFIGWIVGFFFPHTMYLLSQAMNIEASPWQLGIMFGFIAGFFKNNYSFSRN